MGDVIVLATARIALSLRRFNPRLLGDARKRKSGLKKLVNLLTNRRNKIH